MDLVNRLLGRDERKIQGSGQTGIFRHSGKNIAASIAFNAYPEACRESNR